MRLFQESLFFRFVYPRIGPGGEIGHFSNDQQNINCFIQLIYWIPFDKCYETSSPRRFFFSSSSNAWMKAVFILAIDRNDIMDGTSWDAPKSYSVSRFKIRRRQKRDRESRKRLFISKFIEHRLVSVTMAIQYHLSSSLKLFAGAYAVSVYVFFSILAIRLAVCANRVMIIEVGLHKCSPSASLLVSFILFSVFFSRFGSRWYGKNLLALPFLLTAIQLYDYVSIQTAGAEKETHMHSFVHRSH